MNNCIDCNKTLSAKHCIRCRKCYSLHSFGKNSPRYIDGRTSKEHFCLDCNKKLVGVNAIRCNSCAQKVVAKLNNKKSPMLGRKHTKETKEKISMNVKGERNHFYGKKHREESIKKMLDKQLKRWKTIPNCRNKQNKVEKVLERILKDIFYLKYKYVGDCKFFIDRYNPDFVCEEDKKIIELYGDYWHNLPEYIERDKKRIEEYTKAKYKTLIVWEHELKDVETLCHKLVEFDRNT